ncbi:MAG TPA: LysR family transcriptional regulator [Polyangia bacterium]|nr:LysR family transcriptional regulator [Polyangia bacterium]
MDRTEEWRVFVTVAGRRSFVAAARALRRSPQAVTRAVAALEQRLGARLLHRTTRSVSVTGEGERYLERGRRVLAELDALESAPDANAPLAGRLSTTAPVLFGQMHVAPLVCAFLDRHAAVEARLLLVDRVVSLAEEGIDLAVRIGPLPDSSLRARLVGRVRWVVCASPAYLSRAGVPRTPEALARHVCVSFDAGSPLADHWSFPRSGRRERGVALRPRLIVNTAQAGIDAAIAGLGIVRVLSYQVQRPLAEKKLRLILESFAPPPVPINILQLPGVSNRLAAAFVDFAAARLRGALPSIP